jgi:hypothetical protein
MLDFAQSYFLSIQGCWMVMETGFMQPSAECAIAENDMSCAFVAGLGGSKTLI